MAVEPRRFPVSGATELAGWIVLMTASGRRVELVDRVVAFELAGVEVEVGPVEGQVQAVTGRLRMGAGRCVNRRSDVAPVFGSVCQIGN